MYRELMIELIFTFADVLRVEFPETSKNLDGQLGRTILTTTVPMEYLETIQLEALIRALVHAAQGQAGYNSKKDVVKCVEMSQSLLKSIARFEKFTAQGELSI